MKRIFENAVWWSGVVMVGLILGISLQFVRAWTEPIDTPPNGNVGAPINTSIIEQLKLGALGINGLLKLYGGLQVPAGPISGTPQPGNVLTAQPDPLNPAISNGTVGWAAGSGGGGVKTFCGATTATYTGNLGGYSGANQKCSTQFGTGARMCMAADFINGTPNVKGWFSTFISQPVPPTTYFWDCRAWTEGLFYSDWYGVASYGQQWGYGFLSAPKGMAEWAHCSDTVPILCCK
ncbi:hypothetical protein D4R51_00870 [bacterium]|nr:MAG: hypothetical protein D4R51_00870 [bacterium]